LIRLGLALLAGMALALLAVAASGEPGILTAEWLGWRLDTSAAAGAVLTGVLALLAVGFWRLVIWIGEAPHRAALQRQATRRRDSYAALARGYLALASGDVEDARRMARRAADAAEDAPILAGLLAAQSAELAREDATARAAYESLLAYPDAQGPARQGLARLSWQAGDREGALEQARAGEVAGRGGGWAWRMQFDDRLEAGDWEGALALLAGPGAKRSLAADKAARARAALLTVRALEAGAEAQARDAVKAAGLSPDFVPAAVLAARLEAAAGRPGRGEVLLLKAWKAAPHPALAVAYRDLRPGETPDERARRYARLIARFPDHPESRALDVERALLSGDATTIDRAVAGLDQAPDTARWLDLKARAAWANGRVAEARTFAAQAAAAPRDTTTGSETLDYDHGGWVRLITRWTDEAELAESFSGSSASPRPDAPAASPGDTISAPTPEAEPPWRAPDDPGDWDEGEPAPEPTPPTTPRRRAAAPRKRVKR
jgi:HemY protein